MTHEEVFWGELGKFRPKFIQLNSKLYRWKFGVHAQAIFYALIALVIGIIGVCMDINNTDLNAFSRSGSLIVAVGLMLGAQNLGSKIKKDMKFIQQLIMAIKLDEIEAMEASPASIRQDEAPIIRTDLLSAKMKRKNLPNDMKEKTARVIRNTYMVEIFIATIGTIIWGFGDLASKLF